MIVDDHAGVRRMIRQLVAAPGDAVRECSSGDEAVRVAARFRPDFVTMDVRMPGRSGLDAARAILAARPEVRIVMVTNYDQPSLRRAAMEAGAIELVSKENLEQVRPLFLSHAAEQPAQQSRPQAVPTTNDPGLRVLMAEDSPLDCELICLRLTECGYRPIVQRVCSEEEMRAALERGQWDIVFTDHDLPGFSGLAALELLHKMRLQIPVLCVSGSADPIVIKRILEAGAFACVNKDDLSTLCATVQRALNQPSSAAPTASSPSPRGRSGPAAPESSPAPPDSDREDGSELP